jgi:hypothetical protein
MIPQSQNFAQFNDAKCYISIHTQTKEFVITDSEDTLYMNDQFFGVNNSLMSCQADKVFGDAFGTFIFRFINAIDSNGQTWLEHLKLRQLVVIRMRSGTAEGTIGKNRVVMVGLIDQITKMETFDGGQPNIAIEIQGSDLGKILQDARLYYKTMDGLSAYLFKNAERNILPVNRRVGDLLSDIIQKQFFEAFDTEVMYQGNLVKLSDLLGYRMGFTDGVCNMSNIFMTENSIWETMKTIINSPFNELFVDIVHKDELNSYVAEAGSITWKPRIEFDNNYVMYVFLRPTPYISSIYGDTTFPLNTSKDQALILLWKSLISNDIEEKDLISSNLTVSSHEVYNQFHVSQEWIETTDKQTPVNISLSDMADIYNLRSRLKYGQQKMESSVNLIKPGVITGTNPATLINDYNKLSPIYWSYWWTRLLHDWFIYNTEYFSGNYVLQGNTTLRVGTIMKYKQQTYGSTQAYWNYYIQGVHHDFVKYQQFRTTVDVIRGFDEWDKISYKKVDSSPKVVQKDPKGVPAVLDYGRTSFETTTKYGDTPLYLVEDLVQRVGSTEVLKHSAAGISLLDVTIASNTLNIPSVSWRQAVDDRRNSGRLIDRTTGLAGVVPDLQNTANENLRISASQADAIYAAKQTVK